MNATNATRGSLEKYMPWLIGLLAAYLTGKAIKRTFWTLFGMYWALHATGMHLFG